MYKFGENNYSYEFDILAKPDYIAKSFNVNKSAKNIDKCNFYLNYWNKLLDNISNNGLKNELYVVPGGRSCSFTRHKINNICIIQSAIYRSKDEVRINLSYFNENITNKDKFIKKLQSDINEQLNLNFEYDISQVKNGKDKLTISMKYNNSIDETVDWMSENIDKVYNFLIDYKVVK